MANYPIKMLKDENNIPFVPLVGANAIVYNDTETLEEKLNKKLEKTNIIAGDNITLSISGNNITINGRAGSSIELIDNITTSTAGIGALDAHQGKVLKEMIPEVIDDVTSTSTTNALSANQGYNLNRNKQDKLISGTNIKTINDQNILGSGNIEIQGGGTEIPIQDNPPANPSEGDLWIDSDDTPILQYEQYSTTEMRIGTWTNDKPLYRKTIIATNLSHGQENVVEHGISNIDDVVNFYGQSKSVQGSNVVFIPLNRSTNNLEHIDSSNAYTEVHLSVIKSYVGHWLTYGTYDLKITIEYTKTID